MEITEYLVDRLIKHLDNVQVRLGEHDRLLAAARAVVEAWYSETPGDISQQVDALRAAVEAADGGEQCRYDARHAE